MEKTYTISEVQDRIDVKIKIEHEELAYAPEKSKLGQTIKTKMLFETLIMLRHLLNHTSYIDYLIDITEKGFGIDPESDQFSETRLETGILMSQNQNSLNEITTNAKKDPQYTQLIGSTIEQLRLAILDEDTKETILQREFFGDERNAEEIVQEKVRKFRDTIGDMCKIFRKIIAEINTIRELPIARFDFDKFAKAFEKVQKGITKEGGKENRLENDKKLAESLSFLSKEPKISPLQPFASDTDPSLYETENDFSEKLEEEEEEDDRFGLTG
ncbi:MAG: hypothetical protein P1V18_04875 [Candidatus Gracilibacteria bacterium]|nr:hypothetical protein [Candidatus Gracilibacteria bacterium]